LSYDVIFYSFHNNFKPEDGGSMFLWNVFIQLQLQNLDALCGVSNTVFGLGSFLVHLILD